VLWRADGAEFAELAWVDRVRPPSAPGTPPDPGHRLRVVGAWVLGAVVGTAVVLGTVPAGVVVVGTAAGAVVVGAEPDGEMVAVPGDRVAGGDRSAPPATTTPTDVLPPGRGRLPTKLASGWLATASATVMAATAIPKASTAATATRCQRIGCGCAWLAPSSLAPFSLASAWSPTRRRSERRATLWADTSEWVYRASAGATSRLTSAAPMRGPFDPEEGRDHGPADRGQRASQQLGNAELFHTTPGGSGWGRRRCRGAPRARPDAAPAAASSAPALATQAGSRQAPPGQEGDRAAWSRCSPGERFRAALVQRAELEAAQGPGEAGSRTTPSTSSLPEFTNPNGTALFLTVVPESCSPIRNPAAVSEPVAHAGGPGTTLQRPSPTLQRTLGRSNIRA
jgi:hypothetical protein